VLLNHQKGVDIKASCAVLKYARSSYYKALQKVQRDQDLAVRTVDGIRLIRQEMPRLGGKKLHFLLRKALLESGHPCLGRDRLFALMREHGLLVKRRRKYAVTTDSNHAFRTYVNLIKDKLVTRPNEVWVSDITYVRTKTGFSYVSLITDLYSRKIVGYHANNSLELQGCMKALKQALKTGKPEIHHSDRGSQYCSYAYTGVLKTNNIEISMAQAGNCYENAVAERMNGILKQEFGLNATFKDLKHVQKALKQAVQTYNTKRPHWAINLMVPDQLHLAA
jgi:transposase InsO family protein